ncbi:hypothetical protein [Paraburkholderia sp. BCC1886]|nr:hypothetical protein [Paraburkholderia sp. BCC1886]
MSGAAHPALQTRNKDGLQQYFQNNYFAKLAPVLAKEISHEG